MPKTCRYLSFFSLVLAIVSIKAFILPPTVLASDSCVQKSPTISVMSGPGGGQVTLYWNEVSGADRYAVVYGNSSGNYIYGALNIGNSSSRSYTVNSLAPGNKYYFKVAAAKDCGSGPLSNEVTAFAGRGGVIMPVTSPVSIYGPVGKQMLRVMSGPIVGEVTLNWQNADSANNYHLVYGTKRGEYQYGALNIGNVTNFKVKMLTPGKMYYFALVPLLDGRPLYTTDAVSAVAKAVVKTQVIETSRESLIEPPPYVQPKVMLPPEVLYQQPIEETTPLVMEPTGIYENESDVQGDQDKRIGSPEDEYYYDGEETGDTEDTEDNESDVQGVQDENPGSGIAEPEPQPDVEW